MGSFDCYCVLCSGPLSLYAADFGSRNGKALRKRRARVERYKRHLAGERLNISDVEDEVGEGDEEMEDAPDYEALERARIAQQELEEDYADHDYEEFSSSSSRSSSEYAGSVDSSDLHTDWIPDVNIRPRTPPAEVEERNDTWSQASDLDIEASWQPYNDKAETSSMFSYTEKGSYDPGFLQKEDIKWLNRCRALAWNSSAGPDGEGKAFISGRGRYDDYGAFNVKKRGREEWDTGAEQLSCTSYLGEEEQVCFAWHEACFGILCKSLGVKVREVDRDVLYGVIRARMNDDRGSLDLRFGLKSECGQFWECLPGEEVCSS
jgi:hypothetical protein